MNEGLSFAYEIVEWTVPLAMIPVVASRHRPHVAFGWLVLVWALPISGTLAWLYLAMYRPQQLRKRRAALDEVQRLAEGLHDDARTEQAQRTLDPDHAALARLVRQLGMRRLGGWPVVAGNRVEVIDEPGDFVERLTRDVASAERSVDLLYYLIADDRAGRRLTDALLEARRRGVRCRVLAGAYASHWESTRSFFRELAPRLEDEGVEVRSLRPLSPLRRGLSRIDLRNHRKIAVIDGRLGYIGSDNVHDPDMGLDDGVWHQVSLRMEGPSVRHLGLAFLHDWLIDGGESAGKEELVDAAEPADGVPAQVVWWSPSDDAPAVKMLVAAFGAARERVVLTTPYFVPDRPVLLALVAAALRGVRIDVVVPARSDRRIADAAARSVFPELLEAGVRIHRHQRGLLHAKTLTFDDRVAVVGSANGDRRSFYLDDEVVALLYDRDVARRVRARQEAYIQASQPVDPEAFRARPVWRRTLDDVVALASPLL
jgi:cardiolipin synthase